MVIYQHQTRIGTFEEQLERHCGAIESIGADEVWVLTFHRRSARAFIIVPAERHVPTLDRRCLAFIQSAWGHGSHFRFGKHTTGKVAREVRKPISGSSTSGTSLVAAPVRVSTRTSESRRTTDPGYVNRNGQQVIRATGLAGTDYGQRVYVLGCGSCGREYGANGSDIFQRRCPWCQRGKPGLPIR
jgi:hypothetical protein